MDSLHLNHTEFMSKSKHETAKQNQKFPFHFFFRFAVEGWGGGDARKMQGNFLVLHTRVRERVRGALVRFTTQSERTERFRATTRSARAISRHSDCFGKKFGFCSGDTAKSSATLSHEFVKGFERSRRVPV